jgi:inorganic triphosphatase YgiF
MSVARESELELELTREELQRVRAHPAPGSLAAGEPVSQTLHSIYFDTPDHRLRALGIAFRLRSEGDRWLQGEGCL